MRSVISMLVVDLPIAFHFTEILLRKESNLNLWNFSEKYENYTMIYDIEIKPMKFQSPKIPV